MEFQFVQHKGTELYTIKMAEEDFETLEDNQVLVQVGWLAAALMMQLPRAGEQSSNGLRSTEHDAHLSVKQTLGTGGD